MQQRPFGELGSSSALTLGGGGLGQLWGPTTREECVATAREAVDSGIDVLDLAPTYGDGEAEVVIGEAFDGVLPSGVRVITKCLAKAPRDRYRTTTELVTALEAVRDAVEVESSPAHATPVPSAPSNERRPSNAGVGGSASPAGSASPKPPAAADTAKDGATANLRWWWQFHQVAVSVVYAVMLYPVWRAREWLPAPWGLVTFMTAVAVVGAVVNLRLHLWFTARVYPAQLDAQRRASALWKRLLDTAFAVLLLSVAATIAPSHPRWAAFFIVMAISSALSARVMEPATTRAAFPDD